jgi:hypothetical protein
MSSPRRKEISEKWTAAGLGICLPSEEDEEH